MDLPITFLEDTLTDNNLFSTYIDFLSAFDFSPRHNSHLHDKEVCRIEVDWARISNTEKHTPIVQVYVILK